MSYFIERSPNSFILIGRGKIIRIFTAESGLRISKEKLFKDSWIQKLDIPKINAFLGNNWARWYRFFDNSSNDSVWQIQFFKFFSHFLNSSLLYFLSMSNHLKCSIDQRPEYDDSCHRRLLELVTPQESWQIVISIYDSWDICLT